MAVSRLAWASSVLPFLAVAVAGAPGRHLVPSYHWYPSTTESQDISGPINVDGVWHVFTDCIPEGSPSRDPLAEATPLHWCHFSSADLVHWEEHPIAIAPDRAFDGTIIDTGAVFQHPNGTVFMLYATSNFTANQRNSTFDGNMCLARARDGMLLRWDKLCDLPGGAGRIDNPTCAWCRETCPAVCAQGENATAPSPFPGIVRRYGHRDPTTPWLDGCGGAGAGAGSVPGSPDPQCWYVLVGSGGTLTRGGPDMSVATLYRSDLDFTSGWTPVYDAQDAFWYSKGQAFYSCPDFFALPGSELYAFFALDNSYYIGEYRSAAAAGGGPRFAVAAPYAHDAGRLMGAGPRSIAKTGGVGVNNVRSNASRRVYFGTNTIAGSQGIPNISPMIGYNHTWAVPALPKDLSLRTLPDGSPALGFAFVPELAALRLSGAGAHARVAGATAAVGVLPVAGRALEIVAEFEPAPNATGQYGLEVLVPTGAVPGLPTACAHIAPGVPCAGYDRPGLDFNVDAECTLTPAQLAAKCDADARCEAWTWVGNASATIPGHAHNKCCMKTAVPNALQPWPDMVCGVARKAPTPYPRCADGSCAVAAGSTAVRYDPARRELDGYPLTLREGEGLRLHVFVDAGFVEAVGNNGTNNFYAMSTGNGSGVRVVGDVVAKSVEIWQLGSIWQ